MVRGLTAALYHSQVEYPLQITADKLPHKGATPKVIVDGVSLAYHIVTSSREYAYDFANGGNYKLYSQKTIEFIATLESAGIEIVFVFPFADGTPTNVPKDVAEARWDKRALDKFRRVQRLRHILEKSGSLKGLLEVLPPMMITEIAETAVQQKVQVLYTRNNVTRFAAKYVANGNADAVVALSSDYVIFKNINYIPIDSITFNDDKMLAFELLNNEIAAKLLQLNDPDKLFQLSVLLGNVYTEPFIVNKYNIQNLLHIKSSTKYQDFLTYGIVSFLNGEEFDSIQQTSPTREMIQSDAQFQKAITDSEAFYNLDTPLEDEGKSDLSEKSAKGEIPDWAPSISEGGDFWYDPVIDDYEHPIKTDNITLPLRKIFYSILKRDTVTEHVPRSDGIVTQEVKSEEGFPDYATLQSLQKKKGGVNRLKSTFHNIAHCSFPPDFKLPKDDPLLKLEEPIQTCGYALRFLVSQCFTNNQVPNSLIKEDSPQSLKDAKVVGAPPLDMFELRSLAVTCVILCLNLGSKFNGPILKPKLRRVKVSAMYQAVVQHLVWMQQLLGIKSANSKPHRFFDGDIFAAIYDAAGEMSGEKFSLYFEDQEKIAKVEKELLDPFISAVLSPFPKEIFDAFTSSPRSFHSVQPVTNEKPVEVIVVKSAFDALMNDDEEEDEGEVALPPPVVAAPPPPPPKKQQPKKRGGKKAAEEDDDMEAFLIAQAQKKAAEAPKQTTAPTKSAVKQPKKRTYVRKVHGTLNQDRQQEFTRESKGEIKRQLKQQGFDYN
ncbi:Protein asteroid 1 [Histomonas meleagridis]|uniref:Protein asteroid 1 n=1 Tax=Histomonas meleagridis TaxID=135588 RepID=UPI00355A65A3|nr:Protein asteroid 1 [Histomonas meleagridis]KAH0797093.1 Protein asteroid 1 [Histomonas meleagridis]